MSDYVEVIARTVLDVVDENGVAVKVPKGAKARITRQAYKDLIQMKAVRRPSKEDSNPLDLDGDGKAGGSVKLSPKHKGGGKWVAVDANDEVVSGNELFDSKDDAQSWIDRRPGGATDLG